MELQRDGGGEGLGHTWDALGVAMDAVLKRLPEFLQGAFVSPDNLQALGAIRQELSDHPKGANLIHGSHGDRLVLTIAFGAQGSELIAFYPWFENGVEITAELGEVREWDSGLEARICANVGDTELIWFDPLYAQNWPYYAGSPMDARWQVVLSAQAESIGMRAPQVFKVAAEKFGQAGDAHGMLDISTQGMAMLLPTLPDWPDIYEFAGTVQAIREQTQFDQPGWIADVRVLRLENDEFIDLPIHFTRAALKGDVPEVGEDVHGHLWLQGRLWMPTPE